MVRGSFRMQYVNQLTEVTPDLSPKVAMGSEMYINRLKRPMISSIRDLDLAATAQGTWGWLTPTKQESQLVSFPCPGIHQMSHGMQDSKTVELF